MTKRRYRALILGAGYRGRAYAAYADAHPDELEIVGVADPVRAETIRAPRYWKKWEDCLAARPAADFVVISLPDTLHYDAAVMAMEAGYHLLLEKPIAVTREECEKLEEMAAARGLLVVVGHVLRYSAYYAHIKAIIDSGEIGEVVSICHQESTGFTKIAHSYCRGIFSVLKKSSPAILNKCSHDFDLFDWWLGRKCRRVSSFGSLYLFRPENAPAGSAARCTACDPKTEANCPWSAMKMYVKSQALRYLFPDQSDEAMEKVVRETPFGRCVYHCDNDVMDHQVVNLEFEGGVTVSHVMSGFTERNARSTRISGTRGEIIGDGENLSVFRFNDASGESSSPKRIAVPNASRHGGGDFNIVTELLRALDRGDPAEYRTIFADALASHYMAFAAEESRAAGGRVIELG